MSTGRRDPAATAGHRNTSGTGAVPGTGPHPDGPARPVPPARPGLRPALTDPLLRVQGLEKTYGARRGPFGNRPGATPVLRGIDFDVARGETLGIVGESGCGKSTTGRCVVRLTAPTRGTVDFGGVDLATARDREVRLARRRLGMVFQDPASSLDPRMTIRAIVEEPLRVHGVADPAERTRRAAEALDRVGLGPRFADRKPHMLSGGQQQRVAVARAVVARPELVLLDEPVSALDVSVRAQVLNLLGELRDEQDITYLFIVHDLAVAEHFSDRIMVLYGGRVMEIGPAADLFHHPAHPYTHVLLSAVPVPDPGAAGRQKIMLRTAEGNAAASAGCPLAARCPVGAGRERCATELPALREVRPDHWTACHYSEESAALGKDHL
ncbi:oligopeptide/dipeptide ABC transporter ATP-binding protein [Streptomyces sp. SHP 1-2]|uniref:oligopeptide/dipeptide ABC transporter ATP-binding protein n=1 Tax=Streptomyces sp. SHP 1-2 TaxID=2769489 RepID=UPI002237A5C3|nr:oligopeptide/dipeptide ABC transporter ATP-binding protein [Streptomyces sp. SHP 1-2]MCW5254129.1 ABC transporter ATP-binding protein [Streptomyces sp. SHP 1-2]